MIIGIDFDNTIVCYDNVYKKIVSDAIFVPPDTPANKAGVKNYLIEQGHESKWTELQGEIYGPLMKYAEPYEGVIPFFQLCNNLNIEINIISHRTKKPIIGTDYDLHIAAKEWLAINKIPIKSESTFFLTEKLEKIKKINELNCQIFIDDLIEILDHPLLNRSIKKILFGKCISNEIQQATSWSEVSKLVFKK